MKIRISKKQTQILESMAMVFLLLGGFALGLHVVGLDTQILNPGLEGPKVYLNYINFRDMFPSDWSGSLNNHYLDVVNSQGQIVNVAETDQFINHSAYFYADKVTWASSQEGSPTVAWQNTGAAGASQTFDLSIDIENNVPLSDIDKYGNPVEPLGGNSSILQLNYPTISNVKQNPDGTVTYNITNTKLILAPADFVIQLSIPATRSNEHGSGWAEGDWTGVHMRFILYWNTWLSTILNNVGSGTSFNDQAPTIPANATNKLSAFKYIGGFPLTAWVGAWNPVVTDTVPAAPADPLWAWGGTSPPTQIPYDVMQNLMAKAEIRPDLTGHAISLYSDLNATVVDSGSMTSNAVNALEALANSKTPDPTVTAIQYFPLDILDLGTYCTGNGLTVGYTVYYPCCYLRIHVVYGLRGTFSYLWTTQTQQQMKYPGYENRTITIIKTPATLDWLLSLLSNPIFDILAGMFLFLIILVVLAIFAPGVLGLASVVASRGAQKLQSKSKPKRRLSENVLSFPFFILRGETWHLKSRVERIEDHWKKRVRVKRRT